MNLPSVRECFCIIREMKMMDHIIDHSVMVSNVAICIARSLRQIQPMVNVRLIRSASLLHDITKTRSFDTGEVHSETGGILMTEKGFPEIGEIIRQHVVLDDSCGQTPVTESEIVNYADKRVLHDKVVSLDRRLAYIRKRYGGDPDLADRIQMLWDDTEALEKKIFRSISFAPEELSGQVRQEIQREKAGQSTT